MRDIKSLFFISVVLLLSCAEPSIEAVLDRYNKGTVPYISVPELVSGENLMIIDTREKEEYEVSHLPGAIWIGNEEIELDQLRLQLSKDTSIVVYCSVGVRSEDFGEKLLEAGYTDVRNLYGGIFQWKNTGHTVVDSTGRATEKVHAYSKYWGRLLTEANKVY